MPKFSAQKINLPPPKKKEKKVKLAIQFDIGFVDRSIKQTVFTHSFRDFKYASRPCRHCDSH